MTSNPAYLKGPCAGVIFDLDGTLADSKLDFKAMRRDLGFAEQTPILEAIAAQVDERMRQQSLAIVLRHELQGALAATLMPGVSELLARLHAENIKIGIFTRNARAVAMLTMERLGIEADTLVAREDAPPKPDPTGLWAICDEWRVGRHAVVFVGDYLYDLDAGRRASIKTILYAPVPPDFEHDCPYEIRHFNELWDHL